MLRTIAQLVITSALLVAAPQIANALERAEPENRVWGKNVEAREGTGAQRGLSAETPWEIPRSHGEIVSEYPDAPRLTTQIGARSAGAAEMVPKLTKALLSQSRIIAQGGRIRDVRRLVSQYGGKAKNWIKKSTPRLDIHGKPGEVHWYEHRGIGRFEEKIVWFD